MSDINLEDVKMMQSQRLDDTESGGGQMKSDVVQSGMVNNLFSDISRLDRVYGRVSLRKAFASIQTTDRSTYYGSHTILTEQVKDPGVSVCFFSSEDWFDTRDSATNRIESYLVKGPQVRMALWGDHFLGTKILKFFTETDWAEPEVGDVLVITTDTPETTEQYARVTDISSEIIKFSDGSGDYFKKILTISIGNQLKNNLLGSEVARNFTYSGMDTVTYDTVAADASRYYGVSTLTEDAAIGQLQVRVNDIQTQLVPSAASQTAVVDAGVGRISSPLIKTSDGTVTRQITFDIKTNAKLFIGEGVIPGSLDFSGGGVSITEDSKGNVYNGSEIVGSITYATGIIIFGNTGLNTSGTGTITYEPACVIGQISQTGGIIIDTNNRGFVYTFNCDPLPQKGTVKIDYLASGKWYSIWDQGNGQLAGSDPSIGSGSVNFDTGSIAMTFGAMPDVDSKVIIYWAKPVEYYDLSGETIPLEYTFSTDNPAVTRNTFSVTWASNTVGAFDDGDGILIYKTWDGAAWIDTGLNIGTIKYTIGKVNLIPHTSGVYPVATEGFSIKYSYGAPIEENFFAPPREPGTGHITINISNTPIIPGTFRIEWHNYVIEYDPETRLDADRDPTYVYFDDSAGEFENDIDDGTTNWIKGTVDYATGTVTFHPERTTVFPYAKYDWVDSEWLHPGVVQTRVYSGVDYLPALSYFPQEGTVYTSFCSVDGVNQDDYITNIEPKFFVKKDKPGLEIIPGGLGVRFSGQYLIDGANGKLYVHLDGVDGDRTEVGDINYVEKTFSISSDSINMSSAEVLFCSGSAQIDPMQSMVFRTPGSPIQSGSLFIKGTTGEGTIIQGSSLFSGEITGTGITGHIDFSTGLCHVAFGEFVTDDAASQAEDWYNSDLASGGVVWKPFVVRASTILINCTIESYLPLDPELLGLDPVRLPLDGKVPIFRDGYILVVHHSLEEYMPYPLGTGTQLASDLVESAGRTDVNLIEAYSMPTAAQLNEGTQVVPVYIEETGNYTYDLSTGVITFLAGFVYPVDSYGTQNQIIVLSRIEDMCLANDVQVTGHISITNALTHSYPKDETLVSSVLPSRDLQSRAYNEYEQTAWSGVWSDELIGTQPLASYNFVDYPITIVNKPSIQERWLLLFSSSTTISIVGENFGVLAENVSIVNGTNVIGGFACIAIENRQYPGEYYWIIRCDGFGSGWSSGNCIRFNTDPANYPLWFVRTTLQAPPTEPVDYYTIQIRGDSS